MNYAGFERIFWLFDPRHSLLLKLFERHVEMNGGDASNIIDCSEMFLKYARNPDSKLPSLIQPEPERINEEFMAKWIRPASSMRSAAIGFTAEGLESRDGLTVIGASGSIARSLQNKASQMAMLSRHGIEVPEYFGPIPPCDLPERTTQLLSHCEAAYVQPVHSSGGECGARLTSTSDAHDYLHRLEGSHHRINNELLLTSFIEGAQSVSVHGVISKDGHVYILAVVDLLQNGFKFDGFIFPSFSEEKIRIKVYDLAANIGSILLSDSYWGWYTVDFVISKDEDVFVNEINTRFAGESAFIAFMSVSNIFNVMLDLERFEIGPKLLKPKTRLIVTKTRPKAGSIVRPLVGKSNPESFITGKAASFRECYIEGPIISKGCHFIGLFGASVLLECAKETCLQIYFEERIVDESCDESDAARA